MKIEAYACPICEQIFKTEAKASACEKKCKKDAEEAEHEKERITKLDELVHYVRLNAESVEDVCRMSEEVSKKLFKQSWFKEMCLDVRYTDHASNSHSAPIGKECNWGGKQGLPTGYPALRGRITVVYNKQPKGFSSDSFNCRGGIAGICIGTGGYSGSAKGYTVSHDVTLWLDDFPKIKEKVHQQLMVCSEFESLRYSLASEYKAQVANDTFISGCDHDIAKINTELQEVNTRLRKVLDAKEKAKEKIARPLKEVLDIEWQKTENSFGIARPYNEL